MKSMDKIERYKHLARLIRGYAVKITNLEHSGHVGSSLSMAELVGKDTGLSRGHGGSMHLFQPEKGLMGGKVKLPIVIRGQVGVGTREAAQHSRSFESWFVNTPGIKVVMPSTVYDAKGLLKSAIRDDNPVLYLENRVMYDENDEVPLGEWLVPIGVAAVRRQGTDITVVATGYAVKKSLAAAVALSGKIDVEVIDPRTLDPLDMEIILKSVEKTGALLVVQEGVVKAGFAAEVIRRVVEEGFGLLKRPPRSLGAWDVPVPFSPVLEDAAIPQSEDIARSVGQVLGREV